jgi:tetratricopeptide (TPR) repeat protein
MPQQLATSKSGSISLCMIVRNESQNLARCLASVKPYVDEMIVVDTGSEDNTVEIAHQYGANVSHFTWCDDFAAARNYAVSQATSDWILTLDADEELVVTDSNFREQLAANPEMLMYLITIRDMYVDQVPLLLSRVFRNHPQLRYAGRFHEQLEYQGQALPKERVSALTSIYFNHYGYEPEVAERKNRDRNIPILEKIRQEGNHNLMLLTCLANLYHATAQAEKSQECFSEAFDRLLPHLMSGEPPLEKTCVPILLFNLGTRVLEDEDFETSRMICQRGCEWYPNFPPLLYLTGKLLHTLGFYLGATGYFEECLQLGRSGHYLKGESFQPEFMTKIPAHSLGCAYVRLSQWQNAAAAFKLALSFSPDFEEAQQGLEYAEQCMAGV